MMAIKNAGNVFILFKKWCFIFYKTVEARESVSESGILVSKAVDLIIDEVTLKPAGESF